MSRGCFDPTLTELSSGREGMYDIMYTLLWAVECSVCNTR